MLKRRGIKHEVLNAKFHEKEAPIVAQAGRSGAVTIATNMAGRGTDIQLGGNPAGLASQQAPPAGHQPGRGDPRRSTRGPRQGAGGVPRDHDKVVAAGGLHIIGTERHDARRIDNQLRGRAGRQGDPGSSRFYLSLEDTLMKRFASDRVTGAHGAHGPRGRRRHRVAARVQDHRERPVARRGLQLRHPQARRRVRRRHQQAARDDLRRARQGPPQRGPGRDRRWTSSSDELEAARRRAPRRGGRRLGPRRARRALHGWASTASGSTPEALAELGTREAIVEHVLEAAAAQLEARAAEYGAETWAMVERPCCCARSTRCGSTT